MTTLIIIQLVLAIVLVILVLLQGSDNEGLGLGGGTFGGMMSARGSQTGFLDTLIWEHVHAHTRGHVHQVEEDVHDGGAWLVLSNCRSHELSEVSSAGSSA